MGAAWFAAALGADVGAAATTSAGRDAGKQLYEVSCAACHGADGKGVDDELRTPPPDFTDCGFASREADADWLAVVHDGGPVRAFDPAMPAFGEALSSAELGLVLEYVRTFCDDDAWPRGELNFPRLLVTTKAYPEDEAVLSVATATEGSGSIVPTFVYERRLGARNQVEAAVPIVFAARDAAGWSGGVGDLAVSAKRVLFHDNESASILSAALEVVLPTGDEAEGRGGGTTVFEPFLAFGQGLPRDGFAQVQAGVELPTDGGTEAAFGRAALGKTFVQGRFGRSWSPMVEILAAGEIAASAVPDWDVVPQLQVSLSTRQHVLLCAGARLPINDADSRKTTLLVYVLWDWFDGSLFSGW